MKSNIVIIAVMTVVALSLWTCGRLPGPDFSSEESRISEECDSLSRVLEYAMAEDSSAVFISDVVAGLASDAASGSRSDKCRALYWKGRWLERQGLRDSALAVLRHAARECDSVVSPYDYRRIRLILERLDGTLPVVRYFHLVSDEDFYRKHGDTLMMANVAQQLGNIFISTLQYPLALRQYQVADSLLREGGFSAYLTKNRINTAMAYYHCGDSAMADSTLRPLLTNADIHKDRITHNLVLRNMHVITGDRKFISEAYRLLDSVNASKETVAVYEAILSYDYHVNGLSDSADLFASLVFPKVNEIRDLNWRGMALRDYANKLRREGCLDSLVIVQDLFVSTLDSLHSFRQTQELGRLENERGIRKAMESAELSRQRDKVRLLTVFILLIALAAIVVIVLLRLYSRQKIRHMEFLLETERDRRKLLSLTMMIEEKEGFIESLSKEISLLKSSQPSSEVSRLEAIVKQHESDWASKEYFFEAFEKLNPAFIPNLKERCPNLPESLLQLACLIVTGLDNRRISEMLNVRLSSVNQSRWRLRSRIGLSKEESLEEYLRGLC